MFKKLKEKISDEVKLNPRLQGTLDSVNQLAAQTYSAFNKEGSGSRDSLTSLSSLQSLSFTTPQEPQGISSDLDLTVPANGSFFSLGEDDEPVSNTVSPAKNPTLDTGLTMTSTPAASRGRRLSTSSTDASLFPIYEDPGGQEDLPLFSDMESTAGDSSAGWADDSSASLGAVSKEQLYRMLSKMRARYHKYKGRYSDLATAYRKLEIENKKVKEVMQTTQDRALRRISELREQATLEKQAKAHLEEELRAEIEEKEHIIVTLNTKVAILKENTVEDKLINLSHDSGHQEYNQENGSKKISESDNGLQLPDIDSISVKSQEGEKVAQMEDKVRRLESLLSKCKENIKANKNKLGALTEVKDQLAIQLESKEEELKKVEEEKQKVTEELDVFKNREEGEELQMAEAKLAMHREMIVKDEEISTLRVSYNKEKEEKEGRDEEITQLQQEIKEMGHAQESLEKRMEEERKSAMEELSRGKEAALEQERNRLDTEHKKEVSRELKRKEEEWQQKVKEVEEEGRLGREDLELQLAAVTKSDSTSKIKNLQENVKQFQSTKNNLDQQLTNSKKRVKELESLTSSMNDLKAGKIILDEKCKEYLKDIEIKRSKINDLENAIKTNQSSCDEKIEEKNREMSECLSSMSSMEDTIKEHKEQIEAKERQLNYANEEHKKNLENLTFQLKDNANFESSKIGIMNESHRTDIAEKTSEIKRLEEKLIAGETLNIELQERLDINLESSMKSEREFEVKISELEETVKSFDMNFKESEDNLSAKAQELRDANEKVEDLQNYLEKLQHFEIKAKETKELLDTKVLELRDANEELNNIKQIVDEKSNSRVEIEKELASLHDQVNSRQSLHDQMVNYEKELQNRMSSVENEKSDLTSERDGLRIEIETCHKDIGNMRVANEEEICRLKQDLDMKMRLEREKENSHKEFQKQSIEYEKKLQDQLEGNNNLINRLQKDLDESQKEFNNIKESLERRLQSTEQNMDELAHQLNQKVLEAANMSEKCETIEGLLDKKEQMVIILEESEKDIRKKMELQDLQVKEFRENQSKLNNINEIKCEELSKVQSDYEISQTENVKLIKSRERLKQLLDEKDKAFSDVLAEKDGMSGSREIIDRQMKEQVSTLTEEVAKLTELNESLCSESNELRANIDSVNQDSGVKYSENEKLLKELDILKENNEKVMAEKESVESGKFQRDQELIDLQSEHKTLIDQMNVLKDKIEDQMTLKNELVQALSDSKISKEEISNLKIKLQQVENLSHLTEVKEENAMLTERLNQYEDEISRLKKIEEGGSHGVDENIKRQHQEEVKKLQMQIHSLKESVAKNATWNDDLIEDKVKGIIKEFERKIALMDAEHQEDMERLREAEEVELGRANREHREHISSMSADLRQQSEQLEIMEHEHQTALRMAQEEAEEQFEDLKKRFAVEKQDEAIRHEAQLLEARNHHTDIWRADGWDDVHNDHDSPAIFGVPNQPHPANKAPRPASPVLSLEEYPEFEYLRNILFEYMMGKQPLILVKVLSAIVKFSPDQVDSIIKLEEKKQSYLASFGLAS